MRKRLLITVAVVVALIASPAAATAEPSAGHDIDKHLLEEKLEAFYNAADHSVIAEVRVGDEEWDEAMGPRSLDGEGGKVDEDDRFRIASLSKSMLSTILLQLEAEGEVDFEATLGDYLPGLIPYEAEPTIRQLLQHTGGLPDYFQHLYASLYESGDITDFRENHSTHYRPEELVAIATQDPQLFEPGTDWSYSNAGYVALGLLVEELTGNSLGYELTHRVFEPVGMDDTYQPHENSYGIRGDHPVPYMTTGEEDEPYMDTSSLSNTQLWGAGGVVSTVEDVNDFYDALIDGTLLSEEQLAEATEYVDAQGTMLYGLGLVGLPVVCPGEEQRLYLGHTGGGLGFRTFSFHSPDGDRQVTFTWNVDDWHGHADIDEFNQAYNELVAAGLCGVDIDEAQTLRTQDLPDFAALNEHMRIG